MVLIVCLLGIAALITGCETIERLQESRTLSKPTKNFRKPAAATAKVELTVLTNDRVLVEQSPSEEKVVAQPRRSGTDAIVLDSFARPEEEIKPLAIVEHYLNRATNVTRAQ